jgi:hypothetical protein
MLLLVGEFAEFRKITIFLIRQYKVIFTCGDTVPPQKKGKPAFADRRVSEKI